MDGGRLGSRDHLGLRHLPPGPVSDILADRTGEEERLLFHNADLLAQDALGIFT